MRTMYVESSPGNRTPQRGNIFTNLKVVENKTKLAEQLHDESDF